MRHSLQRTSSSASTASSGRSFFFASSRVKRFSTTARSRKISSISNISQSLRGSTLPSGCSTAAFSKQRMTCTRASASATKDRKAFPSPSPLPAPRDNPARSTNSICAGVSFRGACTETKWSKRGSGTKTTALFGSVFPPAYGLTSAPARVITLKTVLFPLNGSPIIPQ